MQFLPIFEDFDGYCFFVFMVPAFQDDAKSTSTKFPLYLISVLYLVLGLILIVSLVIVKTKVKYTIGVCFLRILVLAGELSAIVAPNAF